MNLFSKPKPRVQRIFAATGHRLTKSLWALGLTALISLGGCGAQGEPVSSSGSASAKAPAPPAQADAVDNAGVSKAAGKENATGAPNTATAQLIQSASAVPRKIIYNATVDLVADNFATAQSGLLGLIRKHGGYLAETTIGGTPGTPRQGTWKIRIPENQFEAFMAAVVRLGELQTTHTDSQDVTAEFYDLQARISNKQVEEKRLLVHLQRSTAKLNEILQVEREISRVRGEIEQMQGRLRLLANMTSLTTITVTLREVKGYVAPKPTTFGSQIARTFHTSFGELRDFGKGLVLLIVAVLPWAFVLMVVGLPLWRLRRRYYPRP